MRLLALDLARNTGWAFTAPGRLPLSGSFSLAKGAMAENAGAVYAELEARISDLIAVNSPAEVWIEAPLPMTGRSLVTEGILFGLAAVAELAAHKRGLPTFKEHVGTIRHQVLGRGNANKDDVAWWCRDNGWLPADDNAADALAVAAYAAACAGYRLVRGEAAKVMA